MHRTEDGAMMNRNSATQAEYTVGVNPEMSKNQQRNKHANQKLG